MKNTKTIKTVGIEDFKRDPHLIDYVDENIIILDNVEATLSDANLYRMECFMMVLCLEGETTIDLNNRTYQLKAEQCAMILPNTLLRRSPKIERLSVRIVAISPDFLKSSIHLNKELWNIGYYLYHNPIFPINREASYKFYLYKELLMNCISEESKPFLKEAKKHLFSAIFCELLSKLYDDISVDENAPDYRNDRSMYIFRKFMEKVNEDDGTHRSVAYYADMMCYSPKHLSTVIRNRCGKAPLSIINEHAMERIKYQLRHSDLSMKEIADMFDFANPSFFGKFVKQHLGMAPQQYRNSLKE